MSNIGFFVRTGNPNGQKVAQYIGVMQQEGAGTAWAFNTDLVRNAGLGGENAFGGLEGSGKPGRPGAVGKDNGSIGYELDFTNWDADSRPGVGAFTVGQYIHAQGSFTSLAAIYLDANMDKTAGKAGWADGILFNSDNLISDNTIYDASNSMSSVSIAGRHDIGLNTSLANKSMHAIVMREGQTACFDGLSNCISFGQQRITYTNKKGEAVFSIDENGNAYFKGHVYSR